MYSSKFLNSVLKNDLYSELLVYFSNQQKLSEWSDHKVKQIV